MIKVRNKAIWDDMSFEFAVDPKSIFFRCVEDSGEAIMISDTQGVLVYVNPAWCKVYGYSKEEAIGSSPKLLHSGIQSQEFYEDMWRKILNPRVGTWKGELVNKAKDGTLVPVLLTITPFKDDHQQIAGFMGIAVNMSYQKELETKITHQDRLASIGLLASGLAHEVGTPLGVIRGRAEFLMMQTDSPTMNKNLELITSQIDRISKLIRSLLSISRSVSELNMQNLNLSSVVDEILTLVGQNLKEDSVQISMEIPDNLMIKADHARLQQVFLNLIVNSIYAIKKALEQDKKHPHFLKISALKTDGFIEIQVKDSGCGISPENMKKLFKPFFTTKDVGEGTGLGLAIVAQLMREMGGKISVQSKLNEGTTFTLGIISGQSY